MHLAAKTSEEIVDKALQYWTFCDEIHTATEIEVWVKDYINEGRNAVKRAVSIEPVNISAYNELIDKDVL